MAVRPTQIHCRHIGYPRDPYLRGPLRTELGSPSIVSERRFEDIEVKRGRFLSFELPLQADPR